MQQLLQAFFHQKERQNKNVIFTMKSEVSNLATSLGLLIFNNPRQRRHKLVGIFLAVQVYTPCSLEFIKDRPKGLCRKYQYILG